MRSLSCALTLLLLAAPTAFSQAANSPVGEGVITGIVLDEQGQPFGEAQISITLMQNVGNGGWGSGRNGGTTDGAGRFRLDHVSMGNITVNASKMEEGYGQF